MSPVILLRLFSSISFHFAVHSLHLCTLIPADKLEVWCYLPSTFFIGWKPGAGNERDIICLKAQDEMLAPKQSKKNTIGKKFSHYKVIINRKTFTSGKKSGYREVGDLKVPWQITFNIWIIP